MINTFATLGLIFMLSIVYSTKSYSQDSKNSDPKKFDHFIGLQGNLLIREFFSFNESSDDIENPYLVTYTLRNNETGFSLNTGFGFNSNKRENDDGVNINQEILDIRVGPGYQVKSGKFEFGVGLDAIYRGRGIDTYSQQIVDFGNGIDSTVAKTTSTSRGFGAGIQTSARFYLSERFLIGTEASFRYLSEKEKFHSENFNFIFFQNTESTTYQVENEEADIKSWQFRLPVVIYLIVKF